MLISSFFVADGPTLGGWTQYAPLSADRLSRRPRRRTGVVLWASSIAIFCIGQLLGSLNFITTTLDMRTKGMSLWRMPLTTWAWFITSIMGLTAFAVLMPACILLILDHVAGTSFFVPSNLVINDQLQPHSGGSTLLWQHLFWFFGHPEVYIAIVPGNGHRLPRSDGQHAAAHAQPSRADLLHGRDRRPQLHGLWPSHVCQRDESDLRRIAFSFPTLIITIPCDHHRADLAGQPVWLEDARINSPACSPWG